MARSASHQENIMLALHPLARWLLALGLLAAHLALAAPAAAAGVPTRAADDGPRSPDGGTPFYPPGCGGSAKSQASADVPKLIPDAVDSTHPGVVTSTLNLSGAGSSIWNVNVTLAISHSFNADLDVFLISPAGTRVTLTTDNGGNFDNGFNGTT